MRVRRCRVECHHAQMAAFTVEVVGDERERRERSRAGS